MASRLEIKRHRRDYEVNVYYGRTGGSGYHNILDRDPRKIAQIFLDLYLEGFPIDEALKLFYKRIAHKDWLG